MNDNVEDVKHDDKDGTNLALDIENDIRMILIPQPQLHKTI
ncbi:hypothetical protein [uncultured Gammaproteobacteria bacterium]|nr:hypothetical protein [uncultured Gammaproteobacteria bacterium]